VIDSILRAQSTPADSSPPPRGVKHGWAPGGFRGLPATMGVLLVFMLFLAVSWGQLPASMLEMHLHTLQDPLAVCNDGSRAKYYYRPCPRPAEECAAQGKPQWLVVFENGGVHDSCYDQASCQQGTSNGTNATLSPEGLFSTSGEANPSFYMHHTVLPSLVALGRRQ